jgi:hypothetical protein
MDSIPLHPLFMALYPVAAVLASNLDQVKPTVGGRSAVVSVLVALGLLMAIRVVSHSWTRAALLTTWGLALFYSYGHVYNMLRGLETAGPSLSRHRFLVPTWLLTGIAGSWLVWKKPGSYRRITTVLNLALGAALAFPIGEILLFQRQTVVQAGAGGASTHAETLSAPTGVPLPDIYYIILDAYTSADVLRDSFDLDNRPFLDSLSRMGFYIAECGQSNYSQTELSLSATLNLAYLDGLIDETKLGEEGRRQLWPLIRHSSVRRSLEDLGYRTIAFETGYYWSEWEDADLYLAPERGPFQGLSAFEATLLRSTAAWALVDILPDLPAFLLRDLDRSTDAHRERLLYVFEELENVALVPGPKFVFVHIVSPHRPFVFDAQGNPTDDDYGWEPSDLGLETYQLGYREQIAYLNGRIEKIVRTMIIESEVPPVIVIQGDHGPEEGSGQDRMRILNAMYLAGHRSDGLYPTITSVNTFRVIFNSVFEAGLPLLPDESYFSTYDDLFNYQTVNNDCLP